MFFGRFLRLLLVAVMVIGLFSFFSSAAYRSGWSQGYVTGQAAGSEGGGNVTGAPFNHRGGFHGPFSFFWWGLAACLKLWFFLFFIGLVFKFLFRGCWRRHHHGRPSGPWKGGPWAGWHGRHDHSHHKGHHDGFKGQRPPWYDDSGDEPVMKA